MTKNAPKKKLNRKSRRMIRRSVAALLMITAIGVAAIPVPDIRAGGSTVTLAASSNKRASVSDTRTACVYDVTGRDLNLDPTGILDSSTVPDSNKYKTKRIRRTGKEWELNWQFEYYLTTVEGDNKGIISLYNNSYLEAEVNLGTLSAINYYTVSEAEFNAFYTDNSDPNKGGYTHTLKYDDFVSWKEAGESENLTGEPEWFKKYFRSDFDAYWNICSEVYDAQLEHNEWAAIPGNPEPEPSVPTIATSISRTPGTDFEPIEKYKFYCDMDPNLAAYGTGYTLERVIDSSNTTGGISNYIYVAQGSNANVINATLDEFGFLVVDKSVGIVGIANDAFAGVTKIDTIILPDELIYLGDGAFRNSFIKNINLNSVENVGNRAFKDCTQLKNITFTSAVKNIGAEAFSNVGAENITFTYSVGEIGPGAFANCKYLSNVDMSEIQNCIIDDYAFYNCYELDSVSMQNAGITKIGKGVFAVSSGVTGNWKDVILPAHITDPNGLGDHLFAGRSNLNSVVFPSDMGGNSTNMVNLPESMFNSCAALSYIEFPDTGSKSCGYISYKPCMFMDVTNKDFYVRGPETRLDGEIADPRKSTWGAITLVSDFVPYVYKDASGVEFYEVSDGMYLLTANVDGVLTSCKLNDGVLVPSEGLDLVIPAKVGNYKINSLATDCFSDEDIRDAIGTITVEDDSISEISDGTFKNLPKLKSVVIGNSVKRIGNQAFDGCKQLTEVTFHTPAGGYSGFTIGTDAFRTGSNRLTFNGDIVEGYAPYDWAMQADNYIDRDLGIRVCYRSLSPTNLTVLYDNATGERTLVDYPKYKNVDTDNTAAIKQLQNAFYQQYGVDMVGTEDLSAYADERQAFKNAWDGGTWTWPSDDPTHPYNQEALYGPWVTPSWVEETWPGADAPKPYFDIYPYSIKNCYENPGNFEWQTLTPLAQSLVNSTVKIVVPAGVDSIDAAAYLGENSNRYNVITYLQSDLDSESLSMYKDALSDSKDGIKSIPGLFSGLYKDYSDDTSQEKKYRGNDRIEEVVLQSVKRLPDYAFDSCENLKKVTIGPGCEDIGTAPFRGCDNLSEVVFQNNDKYVGNKAIIYSVNDDGTYTIEECLPYRGLDAIIAPPVVNLNNDPDLAKVSAIKEGAFEDCNFVSAIDLRDTNAVIPLTDIPEKAFKNCKILTQVYLPESVNSIKEEAFAYDFGEDNPSRVTATIPGNEVHIATNAFEHVPTVTIRSYPDSAAYEYADYHKLGWENLAQNFRVIFIDYDGTQLGETQYVEEGKNATPPADPVREGYTFVGWSDEYIGITKDTVLVAQYNQEGTGGNGGNGGNGTGGNGGNGSSDGNNNGSTTADSDGKLYTVMVIKGDGAGSYLSGSTVKIIANSPATGQKFSHWSSSDGVAFANNNSATTTFVMPKKNVTVTANYVSKSGTSSVSGNSSNSKNNGGTKVTINKPGFSNTDISSAVVNGSSDNFIVKISETAAATQAVEAALTAEYGSLENIQYFPMDITLWDSTGTTKITDTTGLSVDITIPLPDALVKYGGNNKAAGVVNDRLDKLSVKFTTIDGVPCVTFRATHFSPYTIYVDTTNLSADTILDSTPKTGDTIHPKWFLAVGLACISMVLFLKKDKVQPAKKTRLA